MSDVESGARASKFARFPPKTGSSSPCSKFRLLPRKACEFQPAELVTACHRFVTTRFLGAKVRKTGPSSRAPSPQGFSRSDSPPRTRLGVRPPRWSVSPPSLSPLMSPLRPAPFLVQKANSEKRVFRVRRRKWCPSLQVRSFSAECRLHAGVRRAPNSVFCPEKPANSSPLNSSPLVTALSPLAFWVQKCAKPGPVPELLLRRVFRGPTARRGPGSESDSGGPSALMSPLRPAPFLLQKALKTVESEESVFPCRAASEMPEPPNSLVFGRKRAPDNHFAQFSAFGPEKAANSSPPSMSPLVTALSPLRHRAEKCAKAPQFPRGLGLLFIISLQIASFVPKHSASCANMSSDSMDIYPKQSQSSTRTYGYLSEGTREPKSLIPRLELGCFTLSNSLAKQNSVQKDFTSGLG